MNIPEFKFKIGSAVFSLDDGKAYVINDYIYSIQQQDWFVRYHALRAGENFTDRLDSFEACFTNYKETTW